MKEIKTTLVVGAGTMGHGFAQIFAMKNLHVIIVDRGEELLERAHAWIERNLEYMLELGEIQREKLKLILDHIYFSTDLKASAQQAEYVLEAVNEVLDLKKKIFQQLDEMTSSDIILATNTSSFDINEIAAVTQHPERVIGTHWFHPPQITPCVEIIPADATSQENVDRTTEFMERLGKVPTTCKSRPGFVANRIQLAMAGEALAIVDEGLATPEEIDRIVKSSFGFRLGAYGPFEIMDQAGADTYRATYEYLYGKLKREQFKPSPTLDKLIAQKRYGLKSQSGFYEYKDGEVEVIKRERDRKFYARLHLFWDEQRREREK